MSSNTNTIDGFLPSLPWHARAVLSLLKNIQVGQLQVISPEGEHLTFKGAHAGIEATIQIHDWEVCRACLKSGGIGFAESYIKGLCDSPDLLALLRLLLANRQEIETIIYGNWWGRLGYRIKHWFNKNTKAGSKKNIHAHYDIGNAFYALWLDPSMTYSSACFDNKDTPLVEAQIAKYQKIIQSLTVAPGEKILEVGCGWGGLMEQACLNGINIDCLTISEEQAKSAVINSYEMFESIGVTEELSNTEGDWVMVYDPSRSDYRAAWFNEVDHKSELIFEADYFAVYVAHLMLSDQELSITELPDGFKMSSKNWAPIRFRVENGLLVAAESDSHSPWKSKFSYQVSEENRKRLIALERELQDSQSLSS